MWPVLVIDGKARHREGRGVVLSGGAPCCCGAAECNLPVAGCCVPGWTGTSPCVPATCGSYSRFRLEVSGSRRRAFTRSYNDLGYIRLYTASADVEFRCAVPLLSVLRTGHVAAQGVCISQVPGECAGFPYATRDEFADEDIGFGVRFGGPDTPMVLALAALGTPNAGLIVPALIDSCYRVYDRNFLEEFGGYREWGARTLTASCGGGSYQASDYRLDNFGPGFTHLNEDEISISWTWTPTTRCTERADEPCPPPPPPLGCCRLPSGLAILAGENACATMQGEWAAGLCGQTPPPGQGCCVLPSGLAAVMSRAMCDAAGGTFDEGEACPPPGPPPPPPPPPPGMGACCLNDGTCVVTSSIDCFSRPNWFRFLDGEPCTSCWGLRSGGCANCGQGGGL